MKSDGKTWIILLVVFLILLLIGIAINVVLSFVIALCLACVTSWFGNDVLLNHLPELTAVIFVFYVFVFRAIEINIKRNNNG